MGLGGIRERVQQRPNYRSLVLLVAMVGAGASSFTGALLFGALPTIAEDLNTTTSVIAWMAIAPAIAFAVSMPIFGKLGDLYGHRRVFIWGWAVAAVLSFAAAAAPNAGILIILRTAGALAGTSTSPAAYGVLARVYAPEERAGPYGRVTVALALSPLIAVTVGGPLVESVGWRLLFIGQGAASVIAVLFAVVLLPETPRQSGVRFDIRGVVTLAIGMTCTLLAVNRARTWGVGDAGLWALAAVGIAVLIIFTTIERRVRDPLLSPKMLSNRKVASGMGTTMFVNAGFNGLDALTPFASASLYGYKAGAISYINGARALGFATAAATARRFASNWPATSVIYLGHSLVIVSGAIVAYGVHRGWPAMFIAGLIVGSFGTGFARPAIATTVTNAVADHDAGVANGANNMAHHIGGSVGQTVLIAIGAEGSAGDIGFAALVASGFAALSLVTASLGRVPVTAKAE